MPNAALIESLQLLLATVGTGLAFWKLWVAVENGLAAESTDLRRLVAETQILGEMFRLFAQGCLMAIGMISVLLPPPGSPIPEYSMEGALQLNLTRFGLITLTILMACDSLVQEYRRRQFLNRVNTPDENRRRVTDRMTLSEKGTS